MQTIDPERLAGIHLAHGKHDSPEQGRCLLEAVSDVAGEPFTDHPACVSRTLAAFGRALSDSSLFADQPDDLVPLIPRLIGTAGAPEVERKRGFLLADWAVREVAPIALEAAGLSEQAATVRALPPVLDAATADNAAYAAARVAAAAAAAAPGAAAYAARAAADAAAYAAYAAEAADAAAAEDAAVRAAYAAGDAADAADARAAVRARALAVFARAIDVTA